MSVDTTDSDLSKKHIRRWAMYDWANSAYYTTTVVVILPILFSKSIVPEGGFELFGTLLQPDALWGYITSLAALCAFILAPVLGAIADVSSSRVAFLKVFCYAGCLAASLLYFAGAGDVVLASVLFIVAQIGFVGGNVFYDAFIPELSATSTSDEDTISGKGYAYGYIGGGIQYLMSLLLVSGAEDFGLSSGEAARLAMLTAAIWWALFGAYAIAGMPKQQAATQREQQRRRISVVEYIRIGVQQTFKTLKRIVKFKHFALFLLAFIIYNDGIQTVISMATSFGTNELKLDTSTLMLTVLIIQFVAAPGAWLFGKYGSAISTKAALMTTLVLWSGIVVYAYFMTTGTEYMILGAVVGIAMGGSQSLSRSLYASCVPQEHSSEYFGFYSVFDKFSAIWGPLVFGVITQLTSSSRMAILSLIAFFVIGLFLLVFVNVDKAREIRLAEH